MSASTQTFYHWPCHPQRALIVTLGLVVIYITCTSINAFASPSPLVRFSLNFINGLALGFIIVLRVWVITIDPEMTWTVNRMAGGAADGGEGNVGGAGRKIKVKRPSLGYQCMRYCVESPVENGEVWVDGYRHEDALLKL